MPGGTKAATFGLAVGIAVASSTSGVHAQDVADRPACAPEVPSTGAPDIAICRNGEALALDVRGFPARSADGRVLFVHATTETAAGVTLSELVFFDADSGVELGRLELGRFEEMLALGHGHEAAREAALAIGSRVARALALLRPFGPRPLAARAPFVGSTRPCRGLSPREAAREECPTRAQLEIDGHVVEARFSRGDYVVLVDGRRITADRAPRIVRDGPDPPCRHPSVPLEAFADDSLIALRFGFLGSDACPEPGDVYRALPTHRVRPVHAPTRELRRELELLRRGQLPWDAPLDEVPSHVLLGLLAGQRARPLAEALVAGADRALARGEPALAEALAASARVLFPELPGARYALARALAVLGRPGEALGELRALSLEPHAGRRLLDRARSEADFATIREREDGRALLGSP